MVDVRRYLSLYWYFLIQRFKILMEYRLNFFIGSISTAILQAASLAAQAIKSAVALGKGEPDALHTLGFFDDAKREAVSDAMDKLNKRYGQHMVYLGGLHGLGDAAPTRIPSIRCRCSGRSSDSGC